MTRALFWDEVRPWFHEYFQFWPDHEDLIWAKSIWPILESAGFFSDHDEDLAMPLAAIVDIRARIGDEVGVSDWLTVDQARIDAFADATEDRQFIHVDPAAAAQTPFGGTIAHGF